MKERFEITRAKLDELIVALRTEGRRVLGPVPRQGAVVFDEIEGVADLPLGLRDVQEPGCYRLEEGIAGQVFGVVNGPQSLKHLFFAPEETLVETRRTGRGLTIREVSPTPTRTAVVGVRPCDLAGVAVQDRIFRHDRYPDAHYAARRENVFLIATDCTRSVSTCFCAAMGTGPQARSGFDLALTELDDGFLVRAGSTAGERHLAALGAAPAAPVRIEEAEKRVQRCAQEMRRRPDVSDLPELLYAEAESPRWDEVAARCLSCTNCTMVCPTCFCHRVVEVAEIDGESCRRRRCWDSCFSLDHAYIHGRNFRPHIRERYRQWLTHKLASWIDQFGTSGCVGCGRCLTWCPVGIDITEELAAIRAASATALAEEGE